MTETGLPEIDWANHPKRKDPRTAEELIRTALTAPDEDSAWEPVVILHFRAAPADLKAAQKLCTSSVARERKLGADILGQLGVPKRAFPEECLRILLTLLQTDTDPGVLQSAGIALGHLRDPLAVPALLKLKGHPSEEVRYGVVIGLLRQTDPLAVEALIELSHDIDEDVRNWAIFGLGTQIDVDTPEIRDALRARLNESDSEIRGEALVGLARRRDKNIVDRVMREIESEELTPLALEAAAEIADPFLFPSLQKLEASKGKLPAHFQMDLSRALEACDPRGTSKVNES